MKKRIMLLITILTFIFCVGEVGATCYEVTTSSKSFYTKTLDNWMGTNYKTVDDSYCSNITNPSGTTTTGTTKALAGCASYGYENCKNNSEYACIWVGSKDTGYCNVDKLQYVRCGDSYDIPKEVPALTSLAINLLKIGTPIVLIVIGMISLVKALTVQKEDEIKKATSSLVKKLISAIIVFFVIYIVQFVILKVADDAEKSSIKACFNCFINNKCTNTYYKSKLASEETCIYVDTRQAFECDK